MFKERTGVVVERPVHEVCGMMQRSKARAGYSVGVIPLFLAAFGLGSGLWSSLVHAEVVKNPIAVFAALDKVTGRISHLEIPINKTVEFGALRRGDPALVAPWFFPTVEEYGRLLAEGGFTVREVALVPRPTPLKTGMEGWLRTFGRSFFDQFPEPDRTKVVSKVVELLRPSLCDTRGVWTADHVRLRFCAERGA